MSREEHLRRGKAKRMAAVVAWFLKLLAMAGFVIGILGSAGYLEHGGDIGIAVQIFLLGVAFVVVTALMAAFVEGMKR